MPTLSFKDILNKKKAQDERASQPERPKVSYFSLKAGTSQRIQFLNELSEDAPNYNPEVGAALYLPEHTSPKDFKLRAVCTFDEENDGRCFGCEMDEKEPFIEMKEKDAEGNVIGETKKIWHPWEQKTNMYIQVITENGEVKVLSRPAPGTVFTQLVEFAVEENEGSLTGVTFKISKGTSKSDKWVITRTNNAFELPETVETVDLSLAVGFKVPYERQRMYYLGQKGITESVTPVAETKPSTGSTDIDW